MENMKNSESVVVVETETAVAPARKKLSLLRNERGDIIEKIVVVALFTVLAAVGLRALSGAVSGKLSEQGQGVTNAPATTF